MVILNTYAQSILDSYIDKYVDYRQKDEHGISPFWYWYYQVRNYIYALDRYSSPVGNNLIYTMPRWGKIMFSRIIIGGEVFVVVTNLKFNQRYFKKWLQHKSSNTPPYSICDTCYGFSSVLYDNSQKYGILKSDGSQLVKLFFDDIINFHHSTENYDIIHAIGFIGDRVYSISMNGEVTLLHISKNDYLSMKHRYDEVIGRINGMVMKEDQKRILKDIIGKTVHKVLREHISKTVST